MKEYRAELDPLDTLVWKTMEGWDGRNSNRIIKKLDRIIDKNPCLITAYNSKCTILEDEGRTEELTLLIEKAYNIVLDRILDSNGNYPDSLPYSCLENRPLLEVLVNQASEKWASADWNEAEKIMRQLLEMNPDDNHGIRIMLLAVFERIGKNDFWDMFPEDDYSSLEKWFNEKGAGYDVLKGYVGV